MVKAAIAVAVFALHFCQSGEGAEDASNDEGDGGLYDFDAGADIDIDAGIDASRGDAGGIQAPGEFDSADPSARACFDGEDNDLFGGMDCEDTSCRSNVPACCVGNGATECCVTGAPVSLPIASCSGSVGDCADIMLHATPFGSPAPEVLVLSGDAAPAFLPRGDSNDSGLLFHDITDPSGNAVTLRASIAATAGGHAAGNDVVALGLTDAASASGLLRVEPIVALLVSGNRAEVALVVAGEIVHREPLADGAFHDYALTIRPGGAIELTEGARSIATASLPMDRALRPVLYGRTFNPSPTAPLPARVRSVSITADVCDVPSSLAAPSAPSALSSGPSWDAVAHVRGPSVAQWTDGDGPHDRMAVEIDSAIYLADRQADGYALSSAIGAPAFLGTDEWNEERVADPVLRWNGTALELWFTGWANGIASVGRVVAAPGTDVFGAAERVLHDPTGSDDYREPAPFRANGTDYLVVRRSGGSDELQLYRQDAGVWIYDRMLRSTTPDDLFAFDRDELGAPSVIFAGDTYRMFFAGRRGSRWSIGLLVSANGLDWLEPQTSVLVYDGSGSGFDALGARDPEPVVEGDVLRLYYAGFDGTRTRLGVALGSAPPVRP